MERLSPLKEHKFKQSALGQDSLWNSITLFYKSWFLNVVIQ